MQEHELKEYQRLRAEGHWTVASEFREAERKRLRAAGRNRHDAREESWEAMLEKYPPQDGQTPSRQSAVELERGGRRIFRIAVRRNTVQLFITTVWAKVFVNGLSFLCSGRHFFQRDIFRLITRGFIRLRRAGIFSQLISQTTASNHSLKLVAVRASHSGRRVFRI